MGEFGRSVREKFLDSLHLFGDDIVDARLIALSLSALSFSAFHLLLFQRRFLNELKDVQLFVDLFFLSAFLVKGLEVG